MPAVQSATTQQRPRAAVGRGFTPETLTGLLTAGVPPRQIRRLLCTYASEDEWRSAPLLEAEDATWRHVVPAPVLADHTLLWGQQNYPAHFELLPSPPPILYVDGDVSKVATGVGVIGARAMSPLGKIVATVAAETAVSLGAPVVSGAAQGVDATALSTAVAAGGTGVAFLGNGLSCGSDEQRMLRTAIVEAGGAVVSELPPSMAPTAGTLMARNRLIAASATPLVVCEAAVKSGTTACAAEAIMLRRPIVVPMPKPGHRRLPGAQGVLALAGNGQRAGKKLGWSNAASQMVAEKEQVANAVCDSREDLASAITVFWWLYTPATATDAA